MRQESKKKATRTILVDDVPVGGVGELVLIAGPCAVESAAQVEKVARVLKRLGIRIMRGGAFKPRTSPHAFQGLGEDGLKILRSAADKFGLKVVTEVMDTAEFEIARRYSHMIQVGARSMYNTCLLKTLGRQKTPVLLKRGLSSTLDEFLMASEYIREAGNDGVLLCERGIRTFEGATRFTLDISSVPVIARRSDLPVVVDPSHAAGDSELVPDLAMAAVAVGADALLLEVHPAPETALCDLNQALTFKQLENLVPRLQELRNLRKDNHTHKS